MNRSIVAFLIAFALTFAVTGVALARVFPQSVPYDPGLTLLAYLFA